MNAILIILKRTGQADTFLELIKSLYTVFSTSLLCRSYCIEPIDLFREVKHGCKISVKLFVIVTNTMLNKMKSRRTGGLMFDSGRISCLANTDNVYMLVSGWIVKQDQQLL